VPDGSGAFAIRVIDRIADIPAASWDACAGPDNPFLSHAFLGALEASGSATARTGWLPQHLALEDEGGRLLGVAPLYLKGHSYGEYVFDHGWADAYQRAGGEYYPKLQCAVPFTPVTGPRLLVRPDAGGAVADALISGMAELARRHKVSSLHVTFPTEGEWERFAAAGFLQRTGQQFHWENAGYASFDDFLAALSSRKRKTIRKEREAALAGGIEIHTLTGRAIERRHWDAFFRFYISTSDRKWGSPYLTREFFDIIGASMA
jgi:predicted N-acyltransferase